jgi:hypothetical protein
MFGFVIGFLCLFGLIKVLRYGRAGACGGGRWGMHGGWGHHGHHGHGGGWGRHGGWREGGGGGGDFWLRGLYQKLDATPGQEKVIRAAVDQIKEAVKGARGELETSRRDVAKAVRTGAVDEVQLGELFARHDEKLREVRLAFVGALAKVNEALDEDQRKRLADMLEGGLGRFGGFGGPYREGHWA